MIWDLYLAEQLACIRYLTPFLFSVVFFYSLSSLHRLTLSGFFLSIENIELRKIYLVYISLAGLLWSSATYLLGSSLGYYQYLFAGLLVALVLFSLSHEIFAVCTLVFALLVRPWELWSDQSILLYIPKLSAQIAVLSFVFHRARKRQFHLYLDPVAILVLLFCVWSLLSTFAAPNLDESIAAWSDSLLRVLIVFVLFVEVAQSEEDFKLFRSVLAVGALAVVSIAYARSIMMGLPYFAPFPAGVRLESLGMMGNSNDLAALAVMVIPLLVFWMAREKFFAFKFFVGGFFTLLCLVVVWRTQSRGALLGVITFVGLHFWLSLKSKKVATFIAASLLVSLFYAQSLLKRDQADISGSNASRISFWKAGIRMGIKNPAFGVGFDQFPEKYEEYAEVIEHEYGKRTIHSTWLLALAESGILAFLLLLSAYGFSIYRAYKMRFLYPELLYSLLGYGVSASFLSHTHLIYPYLLIALVCVAWKIKLNHETSEKF